MTHNEFLSLYSHKESNWNSINGIKKGRYVYADDQVFW